MSFVRVISIIAISALVSAPTFAAVDELGEGAPAEAAVETETMIDSSDSEVGAEAATDEAKDEKPKMVCRYVKSSTSRLSRKVCSPAKE